MPTLRIPTLVLIGAAAWSAAWSAAVPAVTVHPPSVAQKPAIRPVRPPLSDARLEAVIRAKFTKSKINADKFTVHVQGGVATIEGKTDVMQHKGVATRMSKTAGAVAVNNHVLISDAAKAKATGNLEAGRRRVQIRRGEAR